MTNGFQLDPASPVALYVQISDQIRRLVALGALRPGDRLPTVREIAIHARVNRNTAARAIQQLESAGVVSTRVGRGTFVADGADTASQERRERIVDTAIERMLLDVQAAGFPLDQLGPRIDRCVQRAESKRRDET